MTASTDSSSIRQSPPQPMPKTLTVTNARAGDACGLHNDARAQVPRRLPSRRVGIDGYAPSSSPSCALSGGLKVELNIKAQAFGG
jgi:hypothetical protein